MQYCCYPLKRHIRPWEYILPLGLVAGPTLFLSMLIHSGWQPPALLPVFAGSALLAHYGWQGLRSLVENILPLRWDEEEVSWLFRRRRWSDFATIGIVNSSTRQGTNGFLLKFERLLVLGDVDKRELLRLPFQHRDHVTRKLLAPIDPAWSGFLRLLEDRFFLPSGNLTMEMGRFADAEQRAVGVRWQDPAPVITALLLITGSLAFLVLSLYFLPVWFVTVEAFAMVGLLLFLYRDKI